MNAGTATVRARQLFYCTSPTWPRAKATSDLLGEKNDVVERLAAKWRNTSQNALLDG